MLKLWVRLQLDCTQRPGTALSAERCITVQPVTVINGYHEVRQQLKTAERHTSEICLGWQNKTASVRTCLVVRWLLDLSVIFYEVRSFESGVLYIR